MRGGDREAEFREYLIADRTRLMRTAMLLTAGDVHTAEDLVQTACTRVYVHWHRIRHEGAGPYAHRILVLRYFEDLDVATCARILECTEGTVKSQTAKALKRLKDLMAEEPDPATDPATGSS